MSEAVAALLKVLQSMQPETTTKVPDTIPPTPIPVKGTPSNKSNKGYKRGPYKKRAKDVNDPEYQAKVLDMQFVRNAQVIKRFEALSQEKSNLDALEKRIDDLEKSNKNPKLVNKLRREFTQQKLALERLFSNVPDKKDAGAESLPSPHDAGSPTPVATLSQPQPTPSRGEPVEAVQRAHPDDAKAPDHQKPKSSGERATEQRETVLERKPSNPPIHQSRDFSTRAPVPSASVPSTRQPNMDVDRDEDSGPGDDAPTSYRSSNLLRFDTPDAPVIRRDLSRSDAVRSSEGAPKRTRFSDADSMSVDQDDLFTAVQPALRIHPTARVPVSRPNQSSVHQGISYQQRGALPTVRTARPPLNLDRESKIDLYKNLFG